MEQTIKKGAKYMSEKNVLDTSETHALTIIIAPHPDDEIIGCYKYLKEASIIIYDGDTPLERREEALNLKNHLEVNQLFLKSIPPNLYDTKHKFFFPDPIYEIHPLHRSWGFVGEQMARIGLDVTFYNTTMKAPYIHEVEDIEGKKSLLNKIYPSQKSLWEYNHKSFLFEGYCKWIF